MSLSNLPFAPVTSEEIEPLDFQLFYQDGHLEEVYFFINTDSNEFFSMEKASFDKTQKLTEILVNTVECPENLDIDEDTELYYEFITQFHKGEETLAQYESRICEISAIVTNFFPQYRKLS